MFLGKLALIIGGSLDTKFAENHRVNEIFRPKSIDQRSYLSFYPPPVLQHFGPLGQEKILSFLATFQSDFLHENTIFGPRLRRTSLIAPKAHFRRKVALPELFSEDSMSLYI